MKSMKDGRREATFLFTGLLLILIGIAVNPWSVGLLHVVPRPVSRIGNLVLIYAFEFCSIATGVLFVASRKKIDKITISRFARRFWGWYEHASTTIVSALLLFILVNITLHIILALRLQFSAAGTQPIVHSYGETTVKNAYPGRDRATIDRILEETRNRPLVFDPFMGFKEKPFKGEFVEIAPAGYRAIKNQAPWPPDPKWFSIFVLGGSTTFGYGLPGDETISSYLQEILARHTQRRVAVYNFGRAYYFSTHERILFEEFLNKGHLPQMVIFVDGLNDLNLTDGENGPPFINDAFTAALNPTVTERGALSAVANRIPLVKILRKWLDDPQQIVPTVPNQSDLRQTATSRLQRYIANKKLIEAEARTFGIVPFFVWQPIPYYRYDLTYHPFRKSIDRDLAAGALYSVVYHEMEKLAAAGALGNNFLYLGGIQEDEKKPLYVDAVHYSGDFSKKIAQRIADRIRHHSIPAQ